MDRKLKLPIGIDNFEKIRKENFYYVDKTKLIEQLLERWGEVNLFTRPRRFGKTLNMSMLKYFLDSEPVLHPHSSNTNDLLLAGGLVPGYSVLKQNKIK